MCAAQSSTVSQQNLRCDVCRCRKEPFLCADCVNKALKALRNQLNLSEWRSRRDALSSQLQENIQKRRNYDRELRQIRLRIAKQELAKRARNAEKRLKTLQKQMEDVYTASTKKLNGLSAATQQLIAISSAFRSGAGRQYQYEMALLEACKSEVHEEIKCGLMQLTKALEIKRTSAGVEILGHLPPRMSCPFPEMTPSMLNHVGAVLGYVYMMLDRLSHSMSIPLLHVGRFECSTSHIMRPERIFDRHRSPKWMKHRLHCAPEGDWEELVAGARLLKRSLRWLAASIGLEIDDMRISLFDFLLLVLTRAAQRTGASPLEAALEQLVNRSLHESEESDDDWCELDSMILPPPPSDDVAIAHYETAMMMGQDRGDDLRVSFRILWSKLPTLERFTSSIASKTGVWTKHGPNVS